MPQTRSLLILAGLAFAVWETVDIFWISTPAAAAVFAVLFFACTVWYWRRDSAWAAGALLILFAIEGLAAPFLKAMLVTKVCLIALALVGIALAAACEVHRAEGGGLKPRRKRCSAARVRARWLGPVFGNDP